MTLTAAAGSIVVELETLAGWENELLRDLERTRARRAALTRSVEALMAELPDPGRAGLRLRLNRIAMALAGELRANLHQTDKVAAVHGYLARSDGIVTVRQVQAFLKRHGLAPCDDAAAMILSRKAKQGIVERVSRGRYRVCRDHPVIAAAPTPE